MNLGKVIGWSACAGLTAVAVWTVSLGNRASSPLDSGGHTGDAALAVERHSQGSLVPGKIVVSPATSALADYNFGRYALAETKAKNSLVSEHDASRESAQARWILAYSAARRKDLRLARSRFAELREATAGQPWTLEVPRDTQPAAGTAENVSHSDQTAAPPGRPVSRSGEPLPTLEEEAAYQHAVLTVALENAESGGASSHSALRIPHSALEAEREYVEFIRQYPESPLVHAAIRRVGLLHGGDIPKYAEKVWQQAMREGREREHERGRLRSLCGPEVLAEVLRRAGREATVEALARELKTDHQGTTLAALAAAAEKHGLQAKGLKLTWDGLWEVTQGTRSLRKQPGYLVALLHPGHLVLVEAVTAAGVTVWDPSARGQDQPGIRSYSQERWQRAWTGVALRLSPQGP